MSAEPDHLRGIMRALVRKMYEQGWTTEQIDDAVNDGHSAQQTAGAMSEVTDDRAL